MTNPSGLQPVGASAALAAWRQQAQDPRGRQGTGWLPLDSLLYRGGFAPAELVIIGGRTHTRKTTMTTNMVLNMLRAGARVAWVGLDESLPKYAARFASAHSGIPMSVIEEEWETRGVVAVLDEFRARAERLVFSRGLRPSFEDLDGFLYGTGIDFDDHQPDVVVIDYGALLERDRYAGQDVNRIPRMFENLQVWTSQHQVVTLVVHHVGRDSTMSKRRQNHGHRPLMLDDLKYGGEEFADVVLGTFRPALDPLGNMTRDQAEAEYGEDFDETKWGDAVARVRKYWSATFVQLLKNRPGEDLDLQGMELRSIGKSQRMVLPGEDQLADDMTMEEVPVDAN